MGAFDSASLSQFVQLGLQGISTGAIYSLVALGLVLGYKATEVLNFAHGDVLMLSSFAAWYFIVEAGCRSGSRCRWWCCWRRCCAGCSRPA